MADKTQKKTKASDALSDFEKEALRERIKEQRAEAKAGKDRAAGEKDLQAKIASLPDADRKMAERLHAIVTREAPDLMPRTWYGMPAWARDGKVVCFFTPASKFKERYASFGFQPEARLDDGSMWATSFALTKLTKADEQRIAELVRKAAG